MVAASVQGDLIVRPSFFDLSVTEHSPPRTHSPPTHPPPLQGDLIVRPSFFEVSVIHRGASVRDHMVFSYALSLAAMLRSQVGRGRGGAGRVGQVGACLC